MYIRHIYFHHTRGKSSIHHHSPHCKPQKRTQKTFCIIFLSLSVVAVIMELFCCYFFRVLNTFVVCSVMIFFIIIWVPAFQASFYQPLHFIRKRFLILALISNLRISLSYLPNVLLLHRTFSFIKCGLNCIKICIRNGFLYPINEAMNLT